MFVAKLCAYSRSRQDLIALLAGAALVLGYAPFGFASVAILSFFILIALLTQAPPRHALRRGFLFGIGLFGAGASWVVVSIHVFGKTPLPLAIFLTILLVAYLSLFPALFAWLLSKFKLANKPLLLVLVTPALWLLTEWLRGTLFSGFRLNLFCLLIESLG